MAGCDFEGRRRNRKTFGQQFNTRPIGCAFNRRRSHLDFKTVAMQTHNYILGRPGLHIDFKEDALMIFADRHRLVSSYDHLYRSENLLDSPWSHCFASIISVFHHSKWINALTAFYVIDDPAGRNVFSNRNNFDPPAEALNDFTSLHHSRPIIAALCQHRRAQGLNKVIQLMR